MPRPSLLLVETDVQLSVAHELFFRGRGYAVRVANTASEALSLASSAPSDLVLIGNLPDVTFAGTLAQRVRATMVGSGCQIITLSHAMDVDGADLVIPAGAHPRAILDGIRTLARRRTGTRSVLDRRAS